jgi:polyphosphate kinase
LTSKGTTAFVFLEDVVRANLARLFPGTTVKGAYLFRVIRDADLVIQEDEADDLLESIDQGLRQSRHGALALLAVESGVPRRVLDILIENFEIEEENVLRTQGAPGIQRLDAAVEAARPELKYPPFQPAPILGGETPETV